MQQPKQIKDASGKLGILLPGMGAVGTTVIAGCLLARRGLAEPVGSLTQMGTIRLGKRTDGRTPLIKDFVSLAKLDDLVFGGWDLFHDNAYQAACTADVLTREHLDLVKDELEQIKPMPAVFFPEYVKRLRGENVKTESSKWELAQAVREDIRRFKKDNNLRSRRSRCGAARPRSTTSRPRCTARWPSSRRASRPTTRASARR